MFVKLKMLGNFEIVGNLSDSDGGNFKIED
jgi:hypothetical protein